MPPPIRLHLVRAALLCLATFAATVQAQEADATAATRLIGDIGAGFNIAPPVARATSSGNSAIPYANFDYGRAFARIDMFGVQVAPAGYGSVEVLTRVLEDGYTPATPHGPLAHRQSSLPIGIGTLQTTPVGAVFFNLYRDAGKSKGNLVDLIYAAEFDVGPVALYPQAGVEYRSASYVRYYDGLSRDEASRSGLAAYRPGSASNRFLALFMEAHIAGNWYLNANLRRTWLDSAITNSPLARRNAIDSGLVSVSYRFN